MSMNPDETRSRKNRGGRPKEPTKEATLIGFLLPPVICPVCGRGMQPVYIGKRKSGEIDAKCSLGACKFLWTPPRVRPVSPGRQ